LFIDTVRAGRIRQRRNDGETHARDDRARTAGQRLRREQRNRAGREPQTEQTNCIDDERECNRVATIDARDPMRRTEGYEEPGQRSDRDQTCEQQPSF